MNIGDEVRLKNNHEMFGKIIGITGNYVRVEFESGQSGSGGNGLVNACHVETYSPKAVKLTLMDALIKRGQAIIDQYGIEKLVAYRHFSGACACMGNADDEPLCYCEMSLALQTHLIEVVAHFDKDRALDLLKKRVAEAIGQTDDLGADAISTLKRKIVETISSRRSLGNGCDAL